MVCWNHLEYLDRIVLTPAGNMAHARFPRALVGNVLGGAGDPAEGGNQRSDLAKDHSEGCDPILPDYMDLSFHSHHDPGLWRGERGDSSPCVTTNVV